MTIYTIQISLEDLEAKTAQEFNPSSGNWEHQLSHRGGKLYVGTFASGQGNIYGPIIVGNPSKPWLEIQCSDPGVLSDIGAVEQGAMGAEMRTRGLMTAAYRQALISGERRPILNAGGQIIGVMPEHTIAGTNPMSAFLDGMDPEEAPAIPGLEE